MLPTIHHLPNDGRHIVSVSCNDTLTPPPFEFCELEKKLVQNLTNCTINKDDFLLENIVFTYNYEIHLKFDSILADALKEYKGKVVRSLSIKSDLLYHNDSSDCEGSSCDVGNISCDFRFCNLLKKRNCSSTFTAKYWEDVFGWNASIPDIQDPNYDKCIGNKTLKNPPENTECYPISGSIIAELPKAISLNLITIQTRILKYLKAEMSNKAFVTENIPYMTFIGLREKDMIDKTIDTGGRGEISRQDDKSDGITVFGVIFTVMLVISATLSIWVAVRWFRNKRRFNKIKLKRKKNENESESEEKNEENEEEELCFSRSEGVPTEIVPSQYSVELIGNLD